MHEFLCPLPPAYIFQVVRGADLLTSTCRQLLLYRALGLPEPAFFHTPLVLDAQGVRLAKRHDALSLRAMRAQGATPEGLREGWVQPKPHHPEEVVDASAAAGEEERQPRRQRLQEPTAKDESSRAMRELGMTPEGLMEDWVKPELHTEAVAIVVSSAGEEAGAATAAAASRRTDCEGLENF